MPAKAGADTLEIMAISGPRIRAEIVLNMRFLIPAIGLIFCLAAPASAKGEQSQSRVRILLVGNSLTYTNNLPAFIAEMLSADNRVAGVQVDMLAEGGAQLGDWAANGRLADALTRRQYDVVVLQEQGGRVSCAAEVASRVSKSCDRVIDEHRVLATQVKTAGARLLYLGTYQPDPEYSMELVKAEYWVADHIGAEYVEVSETLRRTQSRSSSTKWFNPDGMHPGPMLTALMAVKIFRVIEGGYPQAMTVCLGAPLYTPSAKFIELVEYRPRVGVGEASCVVDSVELDEVIRGDIQ